MVKGNNCRYCSMRLSISMQASHMSAPFYGEIPWLAFVPMAMKRLFYQEPLGPSWPV